MKTYNERKCLESPAVFRVYWGDFCYLIRLILLWMCDMMDMWSNSMSLSPKVAFHFTILIKKSEKTLESPQGLSGKLAHAPQESLITLRTSLGQILLDNPFGLWTFRFLYQSYLDIMSVPRCVLFYQLILVYTIQYMYITVHKNVLWNRIVHSSYQFIIYQISRYQLLLVDSLPWIHRCRSWLTS